MSQPELPPSYEEAKRELEKLKAEGVTSTQLDDAHKEMGRTAATPDSARGLLDEIEQLAKRALAMDEAFEKIRLEFLKVDGNDYTDKDGKPIEKFEPVWKDFQSRFNAMLWRSREAATDAERQLIDFVSTIIPFVRNPEYSLEDKKAELLAFINREPPSSVKSRKIGTRSVEFDELISEIKEFTAKYIAFADKQGADVSDEIKALNERIGQLDDRIAETENIMIEMGLIIGASVVVGGVGSVIALAVLGTAGPGVVVSILIAAITTIIGSLAKMIVALKDGIEASQERNQKQAEVDRLTKELQLLEGLKSSMQRANENVVQTLSRLDNFSAIWGAVVEDAKTIGEYLSKTDDGNLDDSALWNISIMEGSYGILHPGLKSYATHITNSGVRKPRAN